MKTHEEADTKTCYLFHFAVQSNKNKEQSAVVRSSSGDIDIPVMTFGNEMLNLLVYVDNGADRKTNILDFSSFFSLSKNKENHFLACIHLY